MALFDIPKEHQHIPAMTQWRKQAEIMVLCRCKDGANTFPIDQDEKPRYIAVREKLYKEETVVQQPVTPFNSKLIKKEEEKRKRKQVCVNVSGDHIARGFHSELLSLLYWNNR